MEIVMGCDTNNFCPAPLVKKVTDWQLEEPKDKPIEKIRQIRDEIERKALELISNLQN